MKKTLPLFLVICFVLMISSAAFADWVETDGHKMHYPQLPNVVGWDVNATFPVMLADDWSCSETGWVKDIHFWGSWRGGVDGTILSFQVAIYSDVPADPPSIPYSHPGELLWMTEVTDFIIAVPVDPPGPQGWYDPAGGIIIPDDHINYWQYNIFLPEEQWFMQTEGTIYWLQISAILEDPQGTQWGVKSTLDHFLDDATWAVPPEPNWIDIWEPPDFMQSLDLAFVITGGTDATGACCYPSTTQFMTDCIITTSDSCTNVFGGVYEGDGTVCQGVSACCLPDGSCVMADALCCVNELSGSPIAGASCSALEACCLPDGSCADVDPICCLDMGGTPQGAGSACSGSTVACCLPDGSCTDVDPLCCDDLGGTVSTFSTMCLGDANSNGVDDACEPQEVDTCEYYKQGYLDFCPNGMPDFDQKQDTWYLGNPPNQQWTHCGPVALANCLWWFDSKFEPNPIDPRPFYPGPGNPTPNDGYPLVQSYEPTGGVWDDHDTSNVMPFIDSMALYCLTNTAQNGTNVFDLYAGAQSWINNQGLGSDYAVNLYALGAGGTNPADFEFIREQVLASQDVILLVGFWEEIEPGFCERIGGHFVTVAGTCTDLVDSALCISDPYLDNNELINHGSSVHNNASLVSGPHGTIHHDKYYVVPTVCQPMSPPLFTVEFLNYGVNTTNVANFYGLNRYDPSIEPIPPQGGPIHAILEYAVIICPAAARGACCYPDATGSPNKLCIETTEDSCLTFYNGNYEGDGTTCNGVMACCLQDGTCLNVDALCCVEEWGGTPVPGTFCSDSIIACCFDDGTCMDMDRVCCVAAGGTPSPYSMICLGDNDGNGVDDGCEESELDTCEYYKPPYEDYAPNGMPDFDQKNPDWVGPPFGRYTHDGPAALANCMWWFDSKFEPNPVDPRPFFPGPGNPAPNDGFDLVQSYGQWDDHDTNNVFPFIFDLAGYINTNGNPFGGGTYIFDMEVGFNQWLIDHGLEDYFTLEIYPGPSWDLIRDEVLRSQDVILLLGFYEQQGVDFCCRLGAHYVTTAGVCETEDRICISDPFYDKNEGEPPAGSAHGSGVHNDAYYVSGPHGTIHHDSYDVLPQIVPCPPSLAMVELPTYPIVLPDITNFFQLNDWEPMSCDYQQGEIRTLVDWAIVICPCELMIGNCNGDNTVDISDAVYIINFAFGGGPAPIPYAIASGDANCDCVVDISDAVYIINFAFGGGPAPCTCMEWLDRCGPPLQ